MLQDSERKEKGAADGIVATGMIHAGRLDSFSLSPFVPLDCSFADPRYVLTRQRLLNSHRIEPRIATFRTA